MNVAIAVVGYRGVPAKLLEQKGISPDVYDRMNIHPMQMSLMRWGVPRRIETYLVDVGLDFNEYILEPMYSIILTVSCKDASLHHDKPD